MTNPSRKRDVVRQVFEHVRKTCPPDRLIFDNNLVKRISGGQFSNQFDATKFDTSAKLPQILKDNDYFIVHLGRGRHQFVKGITVGYHQLEPIPEDSTIQWPYEKGILDDVETGHSMFHLLNYQVLQDFLYESAAATPNVFHPRYARVSFVHRVYDQRIEARNLGMSIHGALEYDGHLTVCHFVPDNVPDYAIYQFFPQYSYFLNLVTSKRTHVRDMGVACASLSRKGGCPVVTLRQYAFFETAEPASIYLRKTAKYSIVW